MMFYIAWKLTGFIICLSISILLPPSNLIMLFVFIRFFIFVQEDRDYDSLVKESTVWTIFFMAIFLSTMFWFAYRFGSIIFPYKNMEDVKRDIDFLADLIRDYL